MAKHRTNSIPQRGSAATAEAQAHRYYVEGLSFHRLGQLDKAATAYENVLRLVPRHVEALHHIGIVAFQNGNHALAAGFMRTALALNPDMGGVYCDLGNALKELGQFEEALESYDRAIVLTPTDANVHYNRGVALHAMRRYEDAAASYRHALALNPEDAQAYNNCGVAEKELKRYDQALLCYDRALALFPAYQEAHNNRGNVLRELGELAPALACFDHALALDPRFADAHCNRGIVLQALKRPQDALDSYDRALRLNPDFAEAYHNRALTLHKLERWEPALADSQQAIRLRPDYAEAYARLAETLQELKEHGAALKSYDVALRLGYETAELHERRGSALKALKQYDAALECLDRALEMKDYATGHCERGNVLLDLNRYEEALGSYERAIVREPRLAEAHNNRAVALGNLKRNEEALDSFDKALLLDPEQHLARWNRALFYLSEGRLAEGWRDYESRWSTKTLSVYKEKRDFVQPLWLGGEPLDGKTILLYAEQGIGDTLQMCRYVERVAALGARVVLEVHAPLVRLLRSLPGVATIVAGGDPLPAFDLQCPMMSLPHAFGTTLESIPAPAEYLVPDAGRVAEWEATLGPKTKMRVGLVWSGSTIHRGDHHRSIALATAASLVSDRFEFISLQKEVRETDQGVLDSLPQVRHFGPQLGDMADTAALCALMDVVVTVDTSVAHLAGALGKPVWILLPGVADWRWLRERSDSPWYGSARLYRQQVPGDWATVLAAVQSDLARLAA
jgi:tetratricopeptide (TPR) repeat protein